MTKVAELIGELQKDSISIPADGTQVRCVKGNPFIPCLRCGVCCSRYQAQLDLIEARRIADGLCLNWHTFLDNYIEPLWTGADSFLLRQQDGVCIFLKHTDEAHRTICLIHAWKPSACREWTPSPYRRECQEGLLKHWRLRVTPQGKIQGSDERIQRFQIFMESLKKISAYDVSGEVQVVEQYGQGDKFQYQREESLQMLSCPG